MNRSPSMPDIPPPPRFRTGVFLQPVHDPRQNPTVTLQDDLDLIVELDRLGYDEAWIGEHHSSGWEPLPSPAPFLAVAAERTRSIRLGSGIVPLPLHHPLALAVGPGGGIPTDPLVFGLDPARQPAMFLERLDVLMRLFTETEPFDHDGDGFTLRNAVLQLRPRSRPHPEIAIVTGSNRESLRRIGRFGARWLVGTPPDRFEQAWA